MTRVSHTEMFTFLKFQSLLILLLEMKMNLGLLGEDSLRSPTVLSKDMILS